jgi:hypothetical protein
MIPNNNLEEQLAWLQNEENYFAGLVDLDRVNSYIYSLGFSAHLFVQEPPSSEYKFYDNPAKFFPVMKYLPVQGKSIADFLPGYKEDELPDRSLSKPPVRHASNSSANYHNSTANYSNNSFPQQQQHQQQPQRVEPSAVPMAFPNFTLDYNHSTAIDNNKENFASSHAPPPQHASIDLSQEDVQFNLQTSNRIEVTGVILFLG